MSFPPSKDSVQLHILKLRMQTAFQIFYNTAAHLGMRLMTEYTGNKGPDFIKFPGHVLAILYF